MGLLALYFALQLLVGLLSGVLLGFVMGVGIGASHHGESSSKIGAMVREAMSAPDTRTALTAATLMIAAAITLWLAHRRWPRQWHDPLATRGFGFARPSSGSFYAPAVLLGLATPIVGGLLTRWLAQGHAVPQDIAQLGQSASTAARLALAFAAVTVGPLVEETLFRGVLLSALLGFRRDRMALSERTRTIVAIVISASLFGLVHLPDLGFFWYAVPNLALLGAGAAWLRLRSGSLWPAVLAHSLNNLMAVAGWFVATHASHP